MINAIQAQNFRGIRHIDLPVEGRNLIIAGENGAGKSSIVDAIEYYFTGRVEQLEGRSDVDKGQSIPHLKGGPTQVRLALRGVPPEADVALPYPWQEASIPAPLKPLLALGAKRAFILRRSQILDFINARGAERYDRISQIIGLGRVDRMDELWRRERKTAQGDVRELQGDRQEILDRIGKLLGQQVRTEKDILDKVNAWLGDFNLPAIASREGLEQRRKTLRQRSRIEADVGQAEQLRLLKDEAEHVAQGLGEASSKYEGLCQSIQVFWEQSQVLEDAAFEQLLAEGHQVLRERPDLPSCPLCKEPLRDRATLLDRLGERLARLQGLADGRRRISRQQNAVENDLVLLENALASLRHGLETQGLTTHLSVTGAALDETRRWQDALGRPDWTPAHFERWQRKPAIEQLQQALPRIAREIDGHAQALTPTEEEATVLDFLLVLTRVDEQWQMLQGKSIELKKARYVSQQIGLAYDGLIAARKRGLEQVRQELEADFDRLYQQLHPDEGYGAISIPVDQAQRSSITLRARFHEQEETHPLSYYSEGHLDSLGLCIFLAFIKRFNRDLKLIVLDDVLTTVDTGHRLRAARLLAREFKDYQLVITTHDLLWAKELERAIPNAKLMQLRRWNLDQGVDCEQNALSDWEYYAEQALSGRAQDTIAGAGRNLEKFLFQMRSNLGLAVPAKRDRNYTIGDLYGPFFAWVNDAQVERPDRPQFGQELKALQQELDEVWRLRNWSGAHFNEWAATVTPNEALSFLGAIQRLVTAFECPVCQNLVVHDANAKVLLCPHCQPSPPPRIAWEYRPGWHATATKLLQAGKSKVRRSAVPMIQNALATFLRDMRRRLGYSVPATPYDEYTAAQLYAPFFEWAAAHPRPGVSDWQQTVEQKKRALDAWWQAGQWTGVPEAEMASFAVAVREVTALFECDACRQLLGYDHERGAYFCAECSGQATIPSKVSAYWFVKRS
jgi:hypothetical protein